MNLDFLKELNVIIKSAMVKMNVPGAQVAVVKDGTVVFKEAFGCADLEENIEMTTEHMLPIGSATKSFTATAAVMLSEQGKWNLDTPLRNYIPAFELSDSIATTQATARDLLCHRTGVPRHDMMWYNWNDLTREDLALNRMKHLKNNIPFRSGFQYSNQMYAVIGQFIEQVSNLKWEDFVEQYILAPLSIEEYSFLVPYPNESKKYAKLYTPDDTGRNKKTVPLQLEAVGPAGSINMTIGDFIKWVGFQMNGGKAGDNTLLSETAMKELHKPNIPYQILPFEFSERTSIGYALGWTVDSFRGHRVIDHGGNVNGASSLMSFMPEENLGIAILTNANSNMFVYALTMEIYDRYLGFEESRDWFDAFKSNMDALLLAMKGSLHAIYDTKIEGKSHSHHLGEYAGSYSNPGYGTIILSLDSDKLTMQYHSNQMEVAHLHYDIFTFELFGAAYPISFTSGVDGQIKSLNIPFEMAVEPINFTKTQ